jgi:hypothetical protein
MKISVPYFLFAPLLFFVISCANQVAPQGGDKDLKPPKIVKSVPENFSTRFDSKKIQITFDEFIQLKDVNSQLIVSPPLSKTPETKIKQKTLIIEFNDTLRQNTTYTMNFGNAIMDNNEGNPLENFQYVFSTGTVLDSLKVSGKVENALDKKTDKGTLVMLYRTNEDSLPFKKHPDYFAKTNDKGLFQITNIAPAEYKIFALKESNADYIFDAPDESIGFSDTLIEAGSKDIHLALFSEKPKQHILKSFSEEPGKAIVIFAQPAPDLNYHFLSDSLKSDLAFIEESKNKDTIIFWYKNTNLDSLVLLFSNGKTIHDTVSIRLFKNEGKTFSRKKNVLGASMNFKNGEAFDLNKNVILNFNHPILKADLSKIRITEDSIPVTDFKADFNDSLKRILTIRHAWKEKSIYNIFIPPGTFTDLFGLSNDSIIASFKVRQLASYGTVTIKVKVPFKNVQYILQLIDEKETVYRTTIIHNDGEITYDFLEPKAYRFKVIEDINSNGEWDTGNYLKKIQPEKTSYYPDDITIRSNWDVDVSWTVNLE